MSSSALCGVGTATGLALCLTRSRFVSGSSRGSVIDWGRESKGLDSVGRDGGLSAVGGRGSVGLLGGGGDVYGDSHGHSDDSRGDDLI